MKSGHAFSISSAHNVTQAHILSKAHAPLSCLLFMSFLSNVP